MLDLKLSLRKFYNSKKDKFFIRNWPISFIFLVSLVFFYQVILAGKVALPVDALVGAHVPWTEIKWEKYPTGVPIKNQEITDSFSQFYPWRALVGEFWRAGKAPLWNNYMFSGAPFLATLHSAALYPLNFLYLLFSDISSWDILLFIQILLAGIFMYLFLMEMEMGELASLFGGISFMFSGYMVSWLEFATGGQAGIWLPFLLLFEIKLLKTQKVSWLVPISLIFFFIYTAGDFQVPFYEVIVFVLFGIYLSYKLGNGTLKNYFNIFLSLILGLLISSAQILPTVELYLKSIRSGDPYIQQYYFGIMNWEKVANFIWPDFFGNVVTRNYWGKFGFHEYISYIGIVALILVVFSAVLKKVKFEKFFWFLLIFSLLFLFPTPFAFLPYKLHFPGLSSSSASRIIFLADFSLSVLSACGLSKLNSKTISKFIKIIFYFLIITVGVFMGLSACIFIMSNHSPTPVMVQNLKVSIRNMIPSTVLISTLAVASIVFSKKIRKFKLVVFTILLLSVLDLLRFSWKNTPFSPKEFVFPSTKITNFLNNDSSIFRIAGGIPLNLHMKYNIESAEGYDSLYPLTNSQWYSLVNTSTLNALSGRYGQIYNFTSPLINYADVKYVVDYKKNIYGEISERGEYAQGILTSRYNQVFQEGRISVFKNLENYPYVWLSSNYIVSNEDNYTRDLLKNGVVNDPTIILDEQPDMIKSKRGMQADNINVSKYMNEVNINVKSDKSNLLFLSESYDPGWKAYVDGIKTKIFRSNYIFQAIEIPAGEHYVKFVYKPKSFTIGASLSITTIAALIAFFVYEKKFARKS